MGRSAIGYQLSASVLSAYGTFRWLSGLSAFSFPRFKLAAVGSFSSEPGELIAAFI
jgi:hypothetical protein